MSRKCIICKKELSADNKGFLCQYHKDKLREGAAEVRNKAAAGGAAIVVAAKVAYDNKDKLAVLAKRVVTTATDVIKNRT